MVPSSDPTPSSFAGDLAPGQVLGERYRIVAMVGEGGMGQVYLSDDLVLGSPVALKLLPEHTIQQYGLREKAKDGMVYVEMRRCVYGLPQTVLWPTNS